MIWYKADTSVPYPLIADAKLQTWDLLLVLDYLLSTAGMCLGAPNSGFCASMAGQTFSMLGKGKCFLMLLVTPQVIAWLHEPSERHDGMGCMCLGALEGLNPALHFALKALQVCYLPLSFCPFASLRSLLH